jgi:cytidylate kinase
LLDFQREFAGQTGAVLDGRDIGTVIFPEARIKLFVTASLAVRAARRCLEIDGVLVDVMEDLAVRDARDQGRGAAPLKPAADAMLLDTSDMDAEMAFAAAMRLVRSRLS